MNRLAHRCLLPLLAAVALQLTGCSDDSTQAGGPSETPSASDQSSLRDFEGSIAPGSHRVPLISWGRTYPIDALVEVPEGFITPGGWVIENGLNGTAYGDLMFWGD